MSISRCSECGGPLDNPLSVCPSCKATSALNVEVLKMADIIPEEAANKQPDEKINIVEVNLEDAEGDWCPFEDDTYGSGCKVGADFVNPAKPLEIYSPKCYGTPPPKWCPLRKGVLVRAKEKAEGDK